MVSVSGLFRGKNRIVTLAIAIPNSTSSWWERDDRSNDLSSLLGSISNREDSTWIYHKIEQNWSSQQKNEKTHVCDSIIHVRILIKTSSPMLTKGTLRPKTYCKSTSPTCHWNLMALIRLMTGRLFDASSSIEGRQQTIRVELCQSQVPNKVSRKNNVSIGQ